MATGPDNARKEQQAGLDDDLFELNDPEIDPGDMMARIRERVQARRKLYGDDWQEFPAFEAGAHPVQPEDGEHDVILRHDLQLLNETFANRDTAWVLAPSPATSAPVLGRLWRTIRDQAHALVLFYVNRSVGQQVMVDRQIVSVLNRLTAQVESQRREIAGLRQELARLGARENVS